MAKTCCTKAALQTMDIYEENHLQCSKGQHQNPDDSKTLNSESKSDSNSESEDT